MGRGQHWLPRLEVHDSQALVRLFQRSILTSRDENPVGTWEIKVLDEDNPDRTGYFKMWALQLWGEVVDENEARLWHPAEEGQPDEEQVGSAPDATASPTLKPPKVKPTDLLPETHGGELPDTLQPTATDDAGQHPAADEGVFDGIDTLRKHSTWLAGAFLIVVIAALAGGGFFLIRERRRKARLFGLHGGDGGRGAYAPVAEDEMQMGLMERGRRAVGMKGKGGGEESKELYDAFGDGPSDSEDEADEHTALRYHDDFLQDEDDHPHASGSGGGSHEDHGDEKLRVSGDGDATPPRIGSPAVGGIGESNASSGSWQDAADEMRRE